MRNKAHIDTRLSKIYELETFTCGHEENLELVLACNKALGRAFIPEDRICPPGVQCMYVWDVNTEIGLTKNL